MIKKDKWLFWAVTLTVTSFLGLEGWLVTQIHQIDIRTELHGMQLNQVEKKLQEIQNIIKWQRVYSGVPKGGENEFKKTFRAE